MTVTTKQERPGDARSWAVVIDGEVHPSLRNMTREHARHARRLVLRALEPIEA